MINERRHINDNGFVSNYWYDAAGERMVKTSGDGDGFCCSNNGATTRSLNPRQNDNYERAQFYYHPDHLGSSSFITNLDGDVMQHIEYVPFGEVFIEERNNVWNTPYLFNAKELDEETRSRGYPSVRWSLEQGKSG